MLSMCGSGSAGSVLSTLRKLWTSCLAFGSGGFEGSMGCRIGVRVLGK